ncbi:hypothetical protein CsSME_00046614 [Camellia sinensis var. sinensis]|uniref:Uncharacterized protein n=1 Tax=Camellia sinensis TaxID=4442 RepID=A0A7J7GE20_CAMSI|nr:hypothetical protein HYC85_025170 [Camellia sinensis]
MVLSSNHLSFFLPPSIMLHQVWPSLVFWNYLGFISSIGWLFFFLHMDVFSKTTVLVTLMAITTFLSWFILCVLHYKTFVFLQANPRVDRFFAGYERIGRILGSALLFFGNIGLYYYSEKSIACMLAFHFLAIHCLCAIFCIQPYTDFGLLEFLLGASLNQALNVFGIHFYFWLVLIVCIVIVSLRYWLESVQVEQIILLKESELGSNQTLTDQRRSSVFQSSPLKKLETLDAYGREAHHLLSVDGDGINRKLQRVMSS